MITREERLQRFDKWMRETVKSAFYHNNEMMVLAYDNVE